MSVKIILHERGASDPDPLSPPKQATPRRSPGRNPVTLIVRSRSEAGTKVRRRPGSTRRDQGSRSGQGTAKEPTGTEGSQGARCTNAPRFALLLFAGDQPPLPTCGFNRHESIKRHDTLPTHTNRHTDTDTHTHTHTHTHTLNYGARSERARCKVCPSRGGVLKQCEVFLQASSLSSPLMLTRVLR